MDLEDVIKHADALTLFSIEVVVSGAIAIESSSGSDSSSTSSSTSSDELSVSKQKDSFQFIETTPDGVEYFKHKKSCLWRSKKIGKDVCACKAKLNSNFLALPRVLHVRYPKCLKCFPKDPNRIRNVVDLNSALDSALKRACAGDKQLKS